MNHILFVIDAPQLADRLYYVWSEWYEHENDEWFLLNDTRSIEIATTPIQLGVLAKAASWEEWHLTQLGHISTCFIGNGYAIVRIPIEE